MSAWDREALTELRVAVARRDVAAIRAAVSGRELDAVLQLAGDGLLADPADPLARECAERLRRRNLDGDAELADALEGRPSDLAPLAVDLEELDNALWCAAHGGQRVTAELLVARGADPAWVGHDGLTPAAAAERSGAHELAAWLRDRAANPPSS